jgi:hypothetical protein
MCLDLDDLAEPYHELQSFYLNRTREVGTYCQDHCIEWIDEKKAFIQVQIQRHETEHPYEKYSDCFSMLSIAESFTAGSSRRTKCNENSGAAIIVAWNGATHSGTHPTAGMIAGVVIGGITTLILTAIAPFSVGRRRRDGSPSVRASEPMTEPSKNDLFYR